jgi:hypothetical protein
MSIPSYSGGFYKCCNIWPLQDIFHLLVRSYSPAVSFFHGSIYFPYILPFRYSKCIHFSNKLILRHAMAQAVKPRLSQRKPGFTPGPHLSGFVADKVAVGQVFLRVLWFSSVSMIPPWLFMFIFTDG